MSTALNTPTQRQHHRAPDPEIARNIKRINAAMSVDRAV
jgi:hypothetical protein